MKVFSPYIVVNHKTKERIKINATHIEHAKETDSIRVYADNILLLSVKEEHFSVYPLIEDAVEMRFDKNSCILDKKLHEFLKNKK